MVLKQDVVAAEEVAAAAEKASAAATDAANAANAAASVAISASVAASNTASVIAIQAATNAANDAASAAVAASAAAAAAATAAISLRSTLPSASSAPFPPMNFSAVGSSSSGFSHLAKPEPGMEAYQAPAAATPTVAPISEDRIWQGALHVKGHRNDMFVPCAAIRYPTPTRPTVAHAQGWPAQLLCDSVNLKQCANVFEVINDEASEWYVRFAPIDEQGKEISDSKLMQLVKVMVQRQLAFEIDYGEGTVNEGTLYLWGMPMPPHGLSLLGVVRPKRQQ